MWERLLQLLDRLIVIWFAKRAGKSEALQEAQEKVINDIKKRDEIEARNNDTDFDELMRNSGSIG